MSRKSKARGPRRRESPPAAPKRRGRPRWPWAIGALIAAVAAILIVRGGPHRRGGDRAEPALGPSEMVERERQAIVRKDWTEAYDWASRLARLEPHNASLILAQGTALHNVAWGLKRADQTFSTRTSLDRIAIDLQAMALMDSAARLADTPEMWARARGWEGQFYEVLGLPIEALDHYYEVGQRVPGDAKAIGRGRYVLDLLRDPVPKPGAARAEPLTTELPR